MASSSEPESALAFLAQTLESIGIPYMLVGSFASAFYGEPRATQDVDVVVDPTAAQLVALLSRFSGETYYVSSIAAQDALKHRGMFNLVDLESGWKYDLIIRKEHPFNRSEFDRRTAKAAFGGLLYVATAEDVMIAKMQWSAA